MTIGHLVYDVMPSNRRARTDRQKQQRHALLLDAAWTIFQSNTYDTLTIANVAAQAGLAKGTVYLYFATKEELFLAVLHHQLATWFDAVDALLHSASQPCTPAQVASVLASSLTERPALLRLLVLLNALEQNVSHAAERRFKQMLRERLVGTGALLEHGLTFLAPGEGARLLLRAYALVIGLQNLVNPPAIAQEVLREPGMELFHIDFSQEFAATIEALLHGIQN